MRRSRRLELDTRMRRRRRRLELGTRMKRTRMVVQKR
jgi:hypothetical protein